VEKKSLIANRSVVSKAIIASTPSGDISSVTPKSSTNKSTTRVMAKGTAKVSLKGTAKSTMKSTAKSTMKSTAKNALRQAL